MARVLILGGGLAGLAAAAALGEAGHQVDILEARPFLGGRATSYDLPGGETVDNCQHILLRCCVNLLDFYERLGVSNDIEFHREFFFLEPGGRLSTLKAGMLPAPLHFTGSFAALKFLSFGDKVAVARALLAIRSERKRRKDLDGITMLDWLQEKRQTPQAIERFWRPVLVSAVNEDLDRMAAVHGFQVFWLGFLASADSYEMGIPAVPLGDLYTSEAWQRYPNIGLHLRTPVEQFLASSDGINGVIAGSVPWQADCYISALPFERLALLVPEVQPLVARWEHSPITGIHFWFDRPVTRLPHGALLDRTIQWFFNKQDGKYIQLVVSASRSLLEKSKGDVLEIAVRELAEFLPAVRDAKLLHAHVVKEVRATFSARPGMEAERPGPLTNHPNLFLAGDWTHSGWPATMEGAVRSGYIAAEAVCKALGQPQQFLLPDIA
ncbi:MAG: FAD-dependent oxidoreductase [Bryobacterales bacterium]|nr:FAD-dependent oxidoreductase [Bryobacterales bacterium]